MNFHNFLSTRELYPLKQPKHLNNLLEDSFVLGESIPYDYPLPPTVSSTIAIAMSIGTINNCCFEKK